MYPKPDCSDRRPNFSATEETDARGIGWDEGRLSDGRPFRVEMWAQDQVSYLQCFFSAVGLEDLDRRELQQFLERECLIRFRSDKRYAGGHLITDASGNRMWEVSVVIGDEAERYVDCDFVLKPYPRDEAPRRSRQLELDLGLSPISTVSLEPRATRPASHLRRCSQRARKGEGERGITKAQAERVAAVYLRLTTHFEGARVRTVVAWEEIRRICLFDARPGIEESWVAYLQFPHEFGVLRSSRVIVVSRKTGRVLYAGDAGDEG